ncbi:protein ADM2 [Crocuta crocuta]
MAWPLPLTFGCISLLCLLLPGTLSSSLDGSQWPVPLRVPPALTSSSGLGPGHAAGKPVVWKLHRALQPQGGADEDEAPAMAQRLQGGGSLRHLGFRRSLAQHAQPGCTLSTCQVQNLSHRLWKLFNPGNSQDTVPVDLSSANSFG